MKKAVVIFGVLHFVFCMAAFAQTDTEFWFAAPELVRVGSARVQALKFGFATYDQAARVTISQPANSSFSPINLNIDANGYAERDFINQRNTYVETKATGAPVNFGFHIESTAKITAYYQVKGDDSEIYTLKGKNALGTNFIVPMQYTQTRKGEGDGSRSSIEIVATEDDTQVTLTVSRAVQTSAGFQIAPTGGIKTYTLSRGQSVAVRSATGAGSQLRATKVVSDKPVAVNSTDDMVNKGACADLIGDQIVPVGLTGNTYIATSSGSGEEKVYLFPIETGNTIVYANGTPIATLNPDGPTKETYYSMPASGAIFTSDGNNFIAYQISGTGTNSNDVELGGTMLPNVLCTGSKEVAYKALFGAPKITILCKEEDKANFSIGGLPGVTIKPEDFSTLGNGWCSYVRSSFPMPNGTIRLVNTSGYFHFGVLDAQGGTCSYGYFSNYNPVPIESASARAYYRVGDTITLSLNDADEYINIVWKNAGGETVGTGAEIQIPNCTQADAGKYVVQGESVIGCEVNPDTFYVHVFAQAQAENVEICFGNSLTLNAGGTAPFQWSDGSTANSITVSPTELADYWVKSYYLGSDGKASFLLTDTFHVAVRDSLKPEIRGDEFLRYGSATLTVSEDYETYLWNTGATTKTITVNQANDYWVKVTDGDCQGRGTFTVQPAPPINISLPKTEFEVCQDEPNFEIPYDLIAGEVGSAEISINGSNAACYISTSENKIIVAPGNLAPDIYAAELTVYDANNGTSKDFSVSLMIKYPSEIIAQRWNDILGVMNAHYNGGYSFTAFQWYKNGVAMAGETGSYIYNETEFSAANTYRVLLTNSAGKQIFTCDFSPEHLTAGSVQTLVQPLQSLNLKANGTASIYDVAGTVYSVQNTVDNQIVAPGKQGIYFLKFNGKIIKMVVR
jgi:hypothetical protein